MRDLTTYEYPRHLHRGPEAYLRVEHAGQAAAALADGWSLEVGPLPIDDAPDRPEESRPPDQDETPTSAKRGPGRPRKTP